MLFATRKERNADSSSDLADAFPKGKFAAQFRADWLTVMAKDVRANREFQQRTRETARWAREQIRKQSGELFILSNDTTLN